MPRPEAWDSAFGEYFNPPVAPAPAPPAPAPPSRYCQDLRIPDYQRIYRWKKSHLETLFDDLKEYIDETPQANIPTSPYYLGNIVVHDDPGNGWQDIVDGQQRYCALTILSSALRDIALDNESFDLATTIHQQLIASEIWGSGFLSARSEDLARPTNEEDFSNMRYYQHLSQNHMEYQVTYVGVPVGPMGPTNNPIDIESVISRYTIDVATPATHPEIDFGNGITFSMSSDQSGGGAGNITAGGILTQVGGVLTIPAGQTLNTGDTGTVKPIETRESWWRSQFGAGAGAVRKRSWRIPKHFELIKRCFTNDLYELETVLAIRQAKEVANTAAGAPAATPATIGAAINAIISPTTPPAAITALTTIAASATGAANSPAAESEVIKTADGLERIAFRERIEHWFCALNNTAFTITSFSDLEAAIYHFEKMNDKSFSLSLDAGDLMKRLKVVCSRTAKSQYDVARAYPVASLPGGVPAILRTASTSIDTAWGTVQDTLVNAEFNIIGDFLRSTIISNGTNITKSKTYSTHKQSLQDGIQISRGTVPIPATGINNSTRVAQDLAEQNFVVSYFQSMSLLSEFYLDIAKPDLSDITQSDRVELYNLGKNFQQHRPLFLRGMKVINEGRAAVVAAAARAPAGAAGRPIRRLANTTALANWNRLFPRLIFIYEYLVVRGVIFPSTLPNGGIASNRIWAKIAEWSELMFNLPIPATYIDINSCLNTISSEVVAMCSQYPWLSPKFVAQDTIEAAIEASEAPGATQATVSAAISAVATPETTIAETAAITAIATEAAAAPTAADSVEAANAAYPRNIDPLYYTLEVNTSQAAMLLATIEKTRRGSTWALLGGVGAAGGAMFASSKDVEHILPSNAQTDPGEAWDSWNPWIAAGGDIEEYKNRLGNLTLIDSQANRSLGRRSFADKQALPNNGYDAKCAIAAGAGGWRLLDELTSAAQPTWLNSDIDNRSILLLNELFNIFDSNP